jgi:hypothetical protein
MTALLLAAPASAAHKPKHPKHQQKHPKHQQVSKLARQGSDFTGTAAGTLAALSTSALTVRSDDRGVNCTLGDDSPKVGDFHVRDKVKVSCSNGVLTAITKLTPPPPPPPVVPQTAVGTLGALSDAAVTVQTERGDVTCTRGDGSPKLGDFHVGDRVKATCANGVLTALAKLDVTTIATGVLKGFFDGNAVVTSDGGDKTCSRGPTSPSSDGFRAGDKVKMTCLNGVLTALAHVDDYTGGTGTLTALSTASLTVHTDGGDVTCNLTGDSPIPTQFHVGDNVKVACKNGLAYSVTKMT